MQPVGDDLADAYFAPLVETDEFDPVRRPVRRANDRLLDDDRRSACVIGWLERQADHVSRLQRQLGFHLAASNGEVHNGPLRILNLSACRQDSGRERGRVPNQESFIVSLCFHSGPRERCQKPMGTELTPEGIDAKDPQETLPRGAIGGLPHQLHATFWAGGHCCLP